MNNSRGPPSVLQIKCVRRHLLKDQPYNLHVTAHQLLIQKDVSGRPKYIVDLNLQNIIHFQVDKKTNTPISFGIEHNGSMRYFHASERSLDMLRMVIMGRILFSEIKSHYEPIQKIGEGLTSEVFKVRCKRTGQLLAYKSFLIEDKMTTSIFQNEVTKLKQAKHPQILHMYETFRDQNYLYFTSEYCAGGTLCNILKRDGQFHPDNAELILKQILLILMHLHSKKIIHRDIKLSNFMLRSNQLDSLVMIDLGFASEMHQECYGSGTPGYIPPEYFSDHASAPHNDIFSAGVVFFKLLTGLNLFEGNTLEEVHRSNKNYKVQPPYVWSRISPHHQKIIQNMIRQNPSKRMTAEQLLHLLSCRKVMSKSAQCLSNEEEEIEKEQIFTPVIPKLNYKRKTCIT